ncbi:MAG: hypothetical protein SFU84_03360 [Gemmatimonadales bacterium]|nr:hypothetical protein [Gemmatimonadales bacterium]
MSGWEATAQAGQEEPGFDGWKNALMNLAFNDLGINRIRLEIYSGAEQPIDYFARLLAGTISEAEWKDRRYSPINDNADPNSANNANFHFTKLDFEVDAVITPARQLLAARGERLYVSLNYVSFGGSTLHTTNSAEYAELLLATFQHLQSKYGWVPDAIEMILEPDNRTGWSGTQIGNAVVATGNRLAAAGFRPEFIGPSTMSMAQAVPFVNQMVQVPGVLTYLSEISYHRYEGVSDANLSAIGAKAAQHGLRTAMLEHIGSDVEDLYRDVTIANASGWQQFTLAFPTSDNGAQYYTITNGQPVMGSRTGPLRQYFRYVRRGAHRVGATSDNSGVRPVGFTNPGGGPVVVMHASGVETFAITGLRPGRYEVTSSNPAALLPTNPTVGADGELRFTAIPGIITVAHLP